MLLHDTLIILPELLLVMAAMISLLLGVFSERRSMAIVQITTYVSLASALSITISTHYHFQLIFNNLLIINDFTQFTKILILGAALVITLMNQQQLKSDKLDRFEYLILMMFSVAGMMFMVSANDLMVLFIGLELQSLSLYIMLAFKRDDERAAEGAIKYFVLGTLASIFILYGSSLVYGSTQATEFSMIKAWLNITQGDVIAVNIGVIMIIAGLAFKISLAPFHMWAPDVYQGGPTPVIVLLSSAPKIAGIAVFMRLIIMILQPLSTLIEPFVIVLALLSIVIGTFAALFQQNLQRLIAYSTISHMGYAVLSLCNNHISGAQNTLFYVLIYVITVITLFACLMCLRKNGRVVESINDLNGLSQSKPFLASIITAVMLSLAGIPPFAGFFAKYNIFTSIIKMEYYGLAFIGLLLSVVGAAYYLRVIKVMYFDAIVTGNVESKFSDNTSIETLSVAMVGLLLIIGYIFESRWIDHATLKAVASLYPSY